ncbi:MAG: bifunctional adenosylcobinamide kinase/adenosylcobinamide-phosphate guanylyltransferase [Spirochaetia bacterium]|nr:bifunctional adenosylcobinamide kinase/adenosylcobinamide-phosphate guanylyltransferase [Spirochaetia bacterium]
MKQKNKIIFVTGGARSGKSSFAIELACKYTKKYFIATAEKTDPEFEKRIRTHQKERGTDFITIEEPIDLASALIRANKADCIVIDCLTVWLANLQYYNKDITLARDEFINEVKNINASCIIISNEVGMGIVPAEKNTREFRDAHGLLNQKIAKEAHEAYLLVSGIPVKIK